MNPEKIKELVNTYESVIKVVDKKATQDKSRAYGGVVRSVKGSTSTHTLLSYFPDVELNIFTLLKGERKIERPIHKYEHFKPITKERLIEAVNLLSGDLKEFI